MPLVVFDLDGTLVDSRRDLADSTNEMLGTFGAAALPIDDVARMVGEGARVLVARALAASRLDSVAVSEALARFRAIYDRRLVVHTRPYEGIPDLVRSCAGRASLAVLTNKPEQPSRRLLEAFDLAGAFAQVIGGDSDFPRKPDPAGLIHLMSLAGAGPAGTLLVGDSPIDLETGRRAGVPVCIARYGFGASGSMTGAAWAIDRPADLIGVLDRCFGGQ